MAARWGSLPSTRYQRRFRTSRLIGRSYASVSVVLRIWYRFLCGETNVMISRTESLAGRPVGGPPSNDVAGSSRDFRLRPRLLRRFGTVFGPYGPRAIAVTGCTSQMVGMRLFRLGGPGRWPELCVMSKNSDPSMATGIGGW